MSAMTLSAHPRVVSTVTHESVKARVKGEKRPRTPVEVRGSLANAGAIPEQPAGRAHLVLGGTPREGEEFDVFEPALVYARGERVPGDLVSAH